MADTGALSAGEAILMLELYATNDWHRRGLYAGKGFDDEERREALRAALLAQDLADAPAFKRIPTWRELFQRVYDIPLERGKPA